MSEDKANEYFSDGISEELLNLLAKIPQLKVAARTSSFSFKGKQVEIPEIARQLHVANVLEGSVRKSGDQLRITAQLIRAAEGYHLWSETYDRKMDDIFKIQDEIAGEVVRQLKVKLLGRSAESAHDRSEGLRALICRPGNSRGRTRRRRLRSPMRSTGRCSKSIRATPRRGATCPRISPTRRAWACSPARRAMPCPRSGGKGAGDRSRLRTGARRPRLDRDGTATTIPPPQRTFSAGLGARSDRSRRAR